MTQQRSLWECVEEGRSKEQSLRLAEKDQVRRKTIKRLRSGAHWLNLLRVARTIPQPFTLNDISVAVWKAYPEFFGMKGYPYPDNHKVHYILYGTRGLIAKGIVERVSQGIFRIPEGVDPEQMLETGATTHGIEETDESPEDCVDAPATT